MNAIRGGAEGHSQAYWLHASGANTPSLAVKAKALVAGAANFLGFGCVEKHNMTIPWAFLAGRERQRTQPFKGVSEGSPVL